MYEFTVPTLWFDSSGNFHFIDDVILSFNRKLLPP